MLDFIKECNGSNGRWNRKKFWLYPLGLGLLIMIVTALLGFLLGFIIPDYAARIIIPISGIAYLYLFYVSIASYIKRLHDLDKTGWMSLLMFIPLVNIYLFVICGFFKGTQGNNQYGENPLGGTTTTPITDSNSIPNEL